MGCRRWFMHVLMSSPLQVCNNGSRSSTTSTAAQQPRNKLHRDFSGMDWGFNQLTTDESADEYPSSAAGSAQNFHGLLPQGGGSACVPVAVPVESSVCSYSTAIPDIAIAIAIAHQNNEFMLAQSHWGGFPHEQQSASAVVCT